MLIVHKNVSKVLNQESIKVWFKKWREKVKKMLKKDKEEIEIIQAWSNSQWKFNSFRIYFYEKI